MANTITTKFTGADGKNVTYTFTYALPSDEIEAASVKNLMQAMITNKTLFTKQPSVMISANLVSTNTTELDISD